MLMENLIRTFGQKIYRKFHHCNRICYEFTENLLEAHSSTLETEYHSSRVIIRCRNEMKLASFLFIYHYHSFNAIASLVPFIDSWCCSLLCTYIPEIECIKCWIWNGFIMQIFGKWLYQTENQAFFFTRMYIRYTLLIHDNRHWMGKMCCVLVVTNITIPNDGPTHITYNKMFILFKQS